MGSFANPFWLKGVAWVVASVIVALNARLVFDTITTWIAEAENPLWLYLTVVPVVVAIAVLLLYIALPRAWRRKKETVPRPLAPLELPEQKFRRIGVALDFGELNTRVLSHAVSLARHHEAELFLFHVVEGVSGQLFGKQAYDDEARQDVDTLQAITDDLRGKGLTVHPVLGFGRVPKELVRLSKETGIDLLIMGAHGHRGVKDVFFGASISEVRHALTIPVLVVQ